MHPKTLKTRMIKKIGLTRVTRALKITGMLTRMSPKETLIESLMLARESHRRIAWKT